MTKAKRAKKEPAKRKNYKSGTRSTEFKVDERTQKKYLVVAPGKLWKRVQAKAKGVISVRALILGLLTDWVDGKIVYPRPEAGSIEQNRYSNELMADIEANREDRAVPYDEA